MAVHNPHDKFIKELLAQKEHAVELLKAMLSPKIRDQLNWQSLRNEKDSFVSSELREYFSDALFSIERLPLSQDQAEGMDKAHPKSVRLYMLFEHKSKPDHDIHLQLLNYFCRICEKFKKLQVVVTFVFYHGKQLWPSPLSLIDAMQLAAFDRELFQQYIPNFEYTLFDLTSQELKAIQVSAAMRTALQLMQQIWIIEQGTKLEEWLVDARDLLHDEGQEKTVEKILFYLYITTDITVDRLCDAVSRVVPGREEIVMSTATKLIEQGIEQGAYLRALESAQKMLESGAELDFVLHVTSLKLADLIKAGLIEK